MAKAEIASPADKVLSQRLNQLSEADPPGPTRQFPDSRLETVKSMWRDVPLAPIVREAKTKERPFLWPRDGTLGRVDGQPKLHRQESAHTGHDPVARPAAADVDVAIVRVATESMTSAFQFLVEFVEYQITQHRRKRTALRRTLRRRTDQPVFQHPRAYKPADEHEHACIGHPFGDPGHQAVLIDAIEKFLQIDINQPRVAVGHVPLGLRYGLMRRASRSESVAMLRKRRVPSRLEHLQQPLLDESIDDTRNAELSHAAPGLRDVHPFDRLRRICPRQQLFPNDWPVVP